MRSSFPICCLTSLLLLQESVVVAQNTQSAIGTSYADDIQTFVNTQVASSPLNATAGTTVNAGVHSSITIPDLSSASTLVAVEASANQAYAGLTPTATIVPTTTTPTAYVSTVPTTVDPSGVPTANISTDSTAYVSTATTTTTVDENGDDVYVMSEIVGAFPPEEDTTEGNVTGATTTSARASTTCPLTCQNEGQCAVGRLGLTAAYGSPFSLGIFEEEGPLEFHCECTDDFTGLLCEKPFISCNDGNHGCLHGGECLPSFLDTDGVEQYYCDCENAIFQDMRYAGKFCQAQAVETCQEGPSPIYCVNGSCKSQFEATPASPCVCNPGWEGPRCEYASGEAPNCDLDCNTGKCRIGKKEYSQQTNMFVPSDEDHSYCVCPKGFQGENCEIEGAPCGSEHCFHGGTCLVKERNDGTVEHFCDCSSAFTEDVAYAGEFCEAESTAFCTRLPDHNGQSFCVNGGTCKGESHLGCSCVQGFVGPICEFEDKDLGDYTCDLECENNGICRKGAKDIQLLQKFGVNREHLDETYDNNFEHCVCPKGFVGINCEFKMDVCPGANHVCMNGGECMPVRDELGLHFECDCVAAKHKTEMYAGQYCEFESTEFCTLDGLKPKHGAVNSDAFCVNNSDCRGQASADEEHPGCFCASGFDGDHCEMSNPLFPANSSGEDDDDLGIALIAVIVIAAVSVFAVMILIVLTIKKRRYRRNRMSPFNSKMAPPAPTLDHLRALEPWMSPGSLSGSDESSQFSNKAPSSVPSKTHSRKSAVSASLYESNGTVSLMKDATHPVPRASEYQLPFADEENHIIDLSDQGSIA